MPSYTGRYDFQMMRQNFGGIEDQSSLLTTPNNAAVDVLNFDIDASGAISRRGGTELVKDFGSPVVFFKKFFSSGTEVFFAVTSNGKFWSATDPAGTWTDRTGSVTWTDYTTNPIIGAVLASKLILTNGVDAPLVYVHGSNMATLKNASLQSTATTNLTGTFTGAGGGGTRYAIIGVTPRGETTKVMDDSVGNFNVSNGLSSAAANILSWVNNGEFTSFKILQRGQGTVRSGQASTLTNGQWYHIATVGSGATSYTDTGGPLATSGIYPEVSSSTAYNTPAAWESGSVPQGMAYVGKNRDERLFAWYKNTIWACSLSEPTNWFREDDAYVFTVIGGEDTSIKGVAGLFDFTMVMSGKSCFLYSGVSPTTITLAKVIPVGCASHNSITYAGQDVWWWSQYGPTNGSRIINGADVELNTSLTNKIQDLIFTGTNTARWNKIAGATDIVNNRIHWAVPKAAATSNNQTITYNYEVNGFVRYDGFDWVGHAIYNNDVYVASTDGKIYKMNTGDTDNGTAISASYTTGWMDMGSYPMTKRMLWVDVVADARDGNYTFSFDYGVDMNQYEGTAQTATRTTTNGDTISTTSTTAAEHRFYTTAIGNSFQLIFTTSASTPLKLVGWRPEIRARGVRQ